MNEKLKQRLVGAVVLVSLAVIFIPMLLDGGERSSMPLFGSNIPDKPDYHFEPLDIPLQPVTTVPEERPQLIDKPEASPTKEAKPQEKSKIAEVKSPEPAQAKSEPPASVSESSTASSATTSKGQEAWVVQVGSFSQSTNALALRDKLRAKSFTAFVEKLKTDGETIYRVRIGPELKRENADKQLRRLQRVMGMKGIVMGHNS